MKTVALYMSSCLSCFIVMTIFLEFMNERYKRSFKNKYLYLSVKLGLTAAIAGVNMLNSFIFNFLVWVVAVAGCAYFLYYEDAGKPVKRILECEILICIIAVCETLGVVVTDGILEVLGIEITSDLMINSVEVAFSKVILIYLIYLVKVMNDKRHLEYEIMLLERQSELQYQYYVRQEQKYNRTVAILHDVDKHMKLVEQLCSSGEIENAKEYATQVGGMLQPLVPLKYTGNPILDILLTDRAEIMEKKGIKFSVQVDHVSLDFIDAVDVTTIFGNLLDNAIEACEHMEAEKCVCISIKAYYEMAAIQIRNSCSVIHWKKGWPVSEKNGHRGLGLLNVKQIIEKYDGSMNLKAQDGVFIVDIFLNS